MRHAAERHPEAAIVVPPRATAVPSDTAETAPPLAFQRLRRRNLRQLRPRSGTTIFSTSPSTGAWLGKKRPTTRRGPELRQRIGRFKQVIGGALHLRADERRAIEVDDAVHALNRMSELGRPNDARTA